MSRAGHLARHRAVRRSRAAATGPGSPSRPRSSGWSIPSHISFVEPLRPQWPICAPILRVAVGVDEVDDAPPAGDLVVAVEPAAAGRDPALRGDADHLRHHQRRRRRSPRLPRCTRWKSPDRAVDRRVHVHRRDDDAVGQLQLAQPERHEHRRRIGAGAPLRALSARAGGSPRRPARRTRRRASSGCRR